MVYINIVRGAAPELAEVCFFFHLGFDMYRRRG